MTVRPPHEPISWGRSLPFLFAHALPLVAFFLPFHWSYVVLALASYYLRMLFLTIGYHRYFAHRSYQTSRPFALVLAFLAQLSAQKGVLWWASHHRHHHRTSDQDDDHLPGRVRQGCRRPGGKHGVGRGAMGSRGAGQMKEDEAR